MKILWISGWGVPPEWFAAWARAAWRRAEHQVVAPSQAESALAENSYDALGGYSLGSLWLLCHAKNIPENIPVVLLAPIFAFPAEKGRGGKMTRAQLRLQRWRLRQDAPAALDEFFDQADLRKDKPGHGVLTPERIAELDNELGWLESWGAPMPPPKKWLGFTGDEDALTDARELKKLWPALHIVHEADHHPYGLLAAAKKSFEESQP